MNTTTQKATEAVSNTTDNVLKTAENAVESTRAFASDSLDKAGDKVRELRRDGSKAVDQLGTKAQEFAAKGKELAADATTRVRGQVSQYAKATEDYVHEKPVQSVLIGVAAGAAIATAALLASRKRD